MSVRTGDLRVMDSVRPQCGPTEVLVATQASLISGGTERKVRDLAGGSLFEKAKARPDLLRQTIDRARLDGLSKTVRAVRSRLGEEVPLGYSAAGVAEQVGEAVSGLRPGHRVATAGQGHGDVQLVSGNLCVPLPDGLSFDEGAFAAIGSIALNGVRLAQVGPGDRVLVVGLGLVGHLAGRLAAAAGGLPVGIEPDRWKRDRSVSLVETYPSDDSGWATAGLDRGPRVRLCFGSSGSQVFRSDAPSREFREGFWDDRPDRGCGHGTRKTPPLRARGHRLIRRPVAARSG